MNMQDGEVMIEPEKDEHMEVEANSDTDVLQVVVYFFLKWISGIS